MGSAIYNIAKQPDLSNNLYDPIGYRRHIFATMQGRGTPQDELDPYPAATMVPTDDNEANLESDTRSVAQSVETACPPPLDGFVLLLPPEHDTAKSSMTAVKQETKPVRWVNSRTPLEPRPPESSLPAWKYTSPRQSNPAARPPSAMAHRAHTPLPQFANRSATPVPLDNDAMLEQNEQHGVTTYASESTQQLEPDPDDKDHQDILAFTDTLPVAGKFLWNADHRKTTRKQTEMAWAYQQDDVVDAETAYWMERKSHRVPGR